MGWIFHPWESFGRDHSKEHGLPKRGGPALKGGDLRHGKLPHARVDREVPGQAGRLAQLPLDLRMRPVVVHELSDLLLLAGHVGRPAGVAVE